MHLEFFALPYMSSMALVSKHLSLSSFKLFQFLHHFLSVLAYSSLSFQPFIPFQKR